MSSTAKKLRSPPSPSRSVVSNLKGSTLLFTMIAGWSALADSIHFCVASRFIQHHSARTPPNRRITKPDDENKDQSCVSSFTSKRCADSGKVSLKIFGQKVVQKFLAETTKRRFLMSTYNFTN